MFSVTGWNCATGYYSFAHEIMHNLGCNHDRGTTRSCSSASSNYGYRDPAGQFRSIMGYNCRTDQCDKIKKSGCTRVQRVSNPDIKYQGKAIGTATANNAKRINDVRTIVAQYYDSAATGTAAPNGPTTEAPTTAAPPCTDKYTGRCPYWAKFYCTGRWKNWMATNCQKSCFAGAACPAPQ